MTYKQGYFGAGFFREAFFEAAFFGAGLALFFIAGFFGVAERERPFPFSLGVIKSPFAPTKLR